MVADADALNRSEMQFEIDGPVDNVGLCLECKNAGGFVVRVWYIFLSFSGDKLQGFQKWKLVPLFLVQFDIGGAILK